MSELSSVHYFRQENGQIYADVLCQLKQSSSDDIARALERVYNTNTGSNGLKIDVNDIQVQKGNS